MKKDKISLYEFLVLEDREQFDIVFNKGEFIDLQIDGNKRFALYAIDMFFVEVEYNNRRNIITNKTAFVAGEILNKYSNLK
ncbi:MAG: hypothetical protein ACQEWG_06110 [Bacteroidota bacterium]